MLKLSELTDSVLLAELDSSSPWKCNGIAVVSDNGVILIDCNFPGEDLDSLIKQLGRPVLSYFATHFHLDHINNIHEVAARNIPIFAPEVELPYFSRVEKFLKDCGSVDMGALDEMKALVEKYFGSLPAGEPVEVRKPMPVTLEATTKLYHEDNFARTAQLTMVFPSAERYSKDSYALNYLGDLLSGGKKGKGPQPPSPDSLRSEALPVSVSWKPVARSAYLDHEAPRLQLSQLLTCCPNHQWPAAKVCRRGL